MRSTTSPSPSPAARTLALVGESGCGKSTVARLLVGLYAPTRGRSSSTGSTHRAGRPNAVRRRMQMIFQDPYASLNPRWKVQDIVAEPLREHGFAEGRSGAENERQLAERVAELLRSVGLAAADAEKFPHQFSAGSGSGSRSPGRSPPSPSSWSATSRPRRSTSRSRRRCSTS
jgi:peptide/nickel transport system ATP-binding protein